MLVLACVVSVLLLVVSLLRLDIDLLDLRNASRGRYSLDWLQYRTGIASVAELEVLTGPVADDRLYVLSAEQLAAINAATKGCKSRLESRSHNLIISKCNGFKYFSQ